ncbi:unnamed protein product [Spirodela intermedia]|uniref:Uncharacterized protein n=1 Tax=Spirodela intermedia TaxID=51605 RepID=A0A7I8J499_SPIIN|nr:unnamed protein product [Spirodela intermedia]CAA6664890.1 unnamed protein product [Spirodela intermedia]
MCFTGDLSQEELDSFHSNGFLVIESFASAEEVRCMMERMEELLEGFDCSSTNSISRQQTRRTTDDYFFDSAEKISFFFEEKAFGDDGRLNQSKQLSINKVGHALHELDPVFKKFCSSEKIAKLLFSLSYKRPAIIQSMYIFKQPGIGGEVVPHQDNSFLFTEPPSCLGLWLALEDASVSNGCLWPFLAPRRVSVHLACTDGLVRRFIRDDDGVHFDKPSQTYNRDEFIPLEVRAGSLVVIHGDLVHQSFENQSRKSRHALSLHAVETDGCTWAADNWYDDCDKKKRAPEPLRAS